MERRKGLWWPKEDVACYEAIGFLDDLNKCLEFVPREKRKVCVQAGGNMGVWANYLSETFGEVWTIEPRLENYLCLVRNIARSNIRPIWAALGESPGTTGIWCNPANAGSARIDGHGRVPVITIDELELDACDLITLDIEGYEPFAISGAKETIDKYRPVLLIEDRGHSDKFGRDRGWSSEIQGYVVRKRLYRDVLLVHE